MLDKIRKQLEVEWAYLTTLPRPYPWYIICSVGFVIMVLILSGCDPFANSR